MPGPNDRNAKRRVPDALRRRTLISCDRCKTKRIRCIRSNESEPCASCLASGLRCESTVPRKQRLYGSVEGLSLRYRTLEALIKGLFPDEDVGDINTLVRLAQERQIVLPSSNDDVVVGGIFNSSGTSEAGSHTSIHDKRDRRDVKVKSSSGEKLIPAPHGVPHFIGPASSFQFTTAIRRLVAKYNTVTEAYPDINDQQHLRADFANMKVSIALEPRVHPTTTASDDNEDGNLNQKFDGNQKTSVDSDTPFIASPTSSIFARGHYLADILPNRELADELVHQFFEHTHCNYVLFHRGTFQAQYESMWQEDPDTLDPGWTCSLLMVLAFGAQSLEACNSEDKIVIQKRSLRIVRDRFHKLTFTASLSNVQALLLLQLFEHNAGERNTAWLHLGQAARMAIALGMHREGTSGIFEPIERNTRKVVWFTLYTFESFLSLALGRPSMIDSCEVNVSLPSYSLMDGGDFPPDYMQHSMLLTEICHRVTKFVSVASAKLSDGSELLSTCSEAEVLLQSLRHWANELPRHLSADSGSTLRKHRRAVLLMHIFCQHLQTIVSRCYLVYIVNWHVENLPNSEHAELTPRDLPIQNLAHQCSEAATAATTYFQELADSDSLDGITWLDFYYVFHNMLVVSLVLFWQQYDASSLNSSSQAHVLSIHSMLRMCHYNTLAPTYQILLRVAFQFARIVGISINYTSPPPEVQPGPNSESQTHFVSTNIEANTTVIAQAVLPTVDEDIFKMFPDSSGLYFSGNNGLDLDMFSFGLDPSSQSLDARQFPSPAETFGEPGLMVFGQSNPWYR